MNKILKEFGEKWMIALQMDDGEFEHVVAKEHPFFIALNDALHLKEEKNGCGEELPDCDCGNEFDPTYYCGDEIDGEINLCYECQERHKSVEVKK